MAPDPVKCTLKSFGTFSTPSFGGVGEPFNDGRQREDRTTGRQFITNKQRGGQIGDNWNRGQHGKRQGFQRLYDGEKYIEQFKLEQLQDKQARAQNLADAKPWRNAAPNKQSSGLGDYWGCIGPKHKHEVDYEVVKHGEKPGPVVHETKQMTTNPGKKGYGATTPGVIFGPGPQKDEVGYGRYGGREYAHMVEPYDLARQAEHAWAQKNIEALQGRPPYKTMGRAVDFFDQGTGAGERVASSAIFTENPRLPERKPDPPAGTNVSERPFYPAAAPRSGNCPGPKWKSTFEAFPEYKEDPLALKVEAAKKAAEEARAVGAAPFKPTGKPHTTPTPSIVFHEVGPKL